jgi:hypothetical protein
VELEGLQEPATLLYPQADQTSPRFPSSFLQIHFKIILPFTSKCSRIFIVVTRNKLGNACTSPYWCIRFSLSYYISTFLFMNAIFLCYITSQHPLETQNLLGSVTRTSDTKFHQNYSKVKGLWYIMKKHFCVIIWQAVRLFGKRVLEILKCVI